MHGTVAAEGLRKHIFAEATIETIMVKVFVTFLEASGRVVLCGFRMSGSEWVIQNFRFLGSQRLQPFVRKR